VTLRWEEPEDNGGCSITSYAVFRDDGAGADINVNMESASVANKPYLFQYTFTLGSSYEGLEMRFQLQATNDIGSTLSSNYLSLLLAVEPGDPTSVPQNELGYTNTTSLTVTMP